MRPSLFFGLLGKLKCWRFFIGNGSLDEDNWHPWIEVVNKCLASWWSRSLSFGGKALVSNALALS